MHAAAVGQVKVVQILLQYKAETTIRDKDGGTSQDFVTHNGHLEVVKLFGK
jgi:ankyrin repeat protein